MLSSTMLLFKRRENLHDRSNTEAESQWRRLIVESEVVCFSSLSKHLLIDHFWKSINCIFWNIVTFLDSCVHLLCSESDGHVLSHGRLLLLGLNTLASIGRKLPLSFAGRLLMLLQPCLLLLLFITLILVFCLLHCIRGDVAYIILLLAITFLLCKNLG